jgi:hypothetical protein
VYNNFTLLADKAPTVPKLSGPRRCSDFGLETEEWELMVLISLVLKVFLEQSLASSS